MRLPHIPGPMIRRLDATGMRCACPKGCPC